MHRRVKLSRRLTELASFSAHLPQTNEHTVHRKVASSYQRFWFLADATYLGEATDISPRVTFFLFSSFLGKIFSCLFWVTLHDDRETPDRYQSSTSSFEIYSVSVNPSLILSNKKSDELFYRSVHWKYVWFSSCTYLSFLVVSSCNIPL